MADKENPQALKRSWFQELKAEFKKITWPTRKQLTRETIAVVVTAVILGGLITLVDYVLQYGLSFIW